VLAALTGVRSALTVAITSAFWVATAWPTGATAVIIVATACSLLASLEQPVIATLALVRSDATHVPDDRALGIEVGLKYWSEWQDSNLRLQRPERSEYLLSCCFFLVWQLIPSRSVHARFTQFVAISLRRFSMRTALTEALGSSEA
jgi:hypothetical protein